MSYREWKKNSNPEYLQRYLEEMTKPKEMSKMVFTDGACSGNNKMDKSKAKAGYGVFFGDDDSRNISEKLIGEQTNNRAELKALLEAIKICTDDYTIYTDSNYSINCVTKWYKGWKKNGWKTSKGDDVKNRDLIEEIVNQLKFKPLQIEHCNASHDVKNVPTLGTKEYTIYYGNNQADELARRAV